MARAGNKLLAFVDPATFAMRRGCPDMAAPFCQAMLGTCPQVTNPHISCPALSCRQHVIHRTCNCACAGHALRSQFAVSAGTDSYIKGLADLPPCGERTKEDAFTAGRAFAASSAAMAKSKIKARQSRILTARAPAHICTLARLRAHRP